MSVAEGVDYAFPPIPSPAALLAAGKTFACRYGGPGSASKQLTTEERDALHAAGIAIVANAEGAADGLKGGYSAGVAWAKSADEYFARLGLPKGRPIYFSVDYDTTATSWPALDAAMDGIASVIGRDRVGVYGEYALMVHLSGNGKAKWFWQTYAWSGGRWFPGNHIEQYKNGVTIGGADCDLNRAMKADYGQWEGQTMAGEPVKADLWWDRPVPKPLVGKVSAVQLGDVWGQLILGGSPIDGEKGYLVKALDELVARPAAPAAVVDQEQVDAAMAKALSNPTVLAGLAKAINDDAAKRMAA